MAELLSDLEWQEVSELLQMSDFDDVASARHPTVVQHSGTVSSMVKLLEDICLSVIQLELARLPNIGNYLPTVYKECLIERLAWHDLLTPGYLPHVSYNLFSASLRRINLYNCDQVTDKLLELLGKSVKHLETIVINTCVCVTDIGIVDITRNQESLVTLKLRKLKNVTSKGLSCVSSQHLETLDLKGCFNVSFEGVSSVCERNPSIKVLILSGIDDVTGEKETHFKEKHREIIKIVSYLSLNLVEIDSQLNQINNDCLIALAKHCPNLKRLNLHGSSRITGEALIKFSIGCMNLETLDLSYCNSLCSAPCSEALWTLPTSLTELSLCGILLTDCRIFVECFQRLRNLKSARLCGVSTLNDDTLHQILESIGAGLTSLDLSGGMMGELSDKGIGAITKYCSNLECLALSLLTGIDGGELMPMFQDEAQASKFKKLYLSVKQLLPEVVEQVVMSCHNLEKLDLSGLAFVTDDMLVTLADNCTQLQELGLKGCRQVTDYGVCSIVKSFPLRSMVLAGIHNLTDKSIFALANTCHYLEEIYLNGCAQISPAAVRYLIDCTVPRLFVKHAVPNALPNQLMARNLDTGEFCRADLIQYDNQIN